MILKMKFRKCLKVFNFKLLFIFILFPRTAHKMIAYFEEEAVLSYTEYLNMIKNNKIKNIDAPQIAIDYYNLNTESISFKAKEKRVKSIIYF